MTMYTTKILNWLANHSSTTLPGFLKRNPDILRRLIEDTDSISDIKNNMERVYIVLNGPPPYCEFGNKKQFNTFDLGYRKGCIKGNLCKCVSKYRVNGQKATLEERYGVSNANYIPGVLEKRKDTTFKKFGVEYAMQNAEVKKKHKSASALVSTESKIKKTKNTFMQKYGVEHHMKLKSQQDKVKHTNAERYGVEFPT